MPLQEAIIRSARPGDGAKATGLAFNILRSYGINPDPDWLDRDIVAFGTNDPQTVRDFAAEVEGELVKVATLNLKNEPDINKTEGLCTALYVKPEFRRRGKNNS